MNFQSVRKRDGQVVPFDPSRIIQAVSKALSETKEGGNKESESICEAVVKELVKK
mgnify:CR=1 FL=1